MKVADCASLAGQTALCELHLSAVGTNFWDPVGIPYRSASGGPYPTINGGVECTYHHIRIDSSFLNVSGNVIPGNPATFELVITSNVNNSIPVLNVTFSNITTPTIVGFTEIADGGYLGGPRAVGSGYSGSDGTGSLHGSAGERGGTHRSHSLLG